MPMLPMFVIKGTDHLVVSDNKLLALPNWVNLQFWLLAKMCTVQQRSQKQHNKLSSNCFLKSHIIFFVC